MAKLSVSSHYPTTIPIDGVDIDFRIQRLTAAEFFAFSRQYEKVLDPPSERMLLVRREDELAKRPVARQRTAKEQAAADALVTLRECLKTSAHTFPLHDDVSQSRDQVLLALLSEIEAALPAEPDSDDEVFVIPDSEIRTRRLAELSPIERAAWDGLDAEDEAFAASFIVETLTRYVQVAPDQIEADGVPVTSGADLVRYFGGQGAALKALVRAVREENLLPSALKNALRSARDTRPSSSTPDREAPGSEPGPTAASAA